MLITLFSQNRSTASTDVDTASHFTNVFNENIVLPRNCKIGVVNLSVNLNGEIVVNGTNNTFTAELGSHTITCTIASATYKIQEVSSGTGTPTTTYPLIEAIQTAFSSAVSTAGMTGLYPVADNVFKGIKLGNGIGIQIDMRPSTTSASSELALTPATSQTTGIDTSSYSSEIAVNQFTSGAQFNFGDSTPQFYPLDTTGEKDEGSASAVDRYGQVTFQLNSGNLTTNYLLGINLGSSLTTTPKKFCGFEVKADNSIVIRETDPSGIDLFTPVDTGLTYTSTTTKYIRMEVPATAKSSQRYFDYYIKDTTIEDTFRKINMSAVSTASRKTFANTARLRIGGCFISGMESRPATASLINTSGEWTISTAGSGLSTGVSTMASKSSTHGVITGGSINISSVGGSGEATGFNMTGATLPNRSTTGDFANGDTITLTNGVVITKTASALTTDRKTPSIKEVKATYVVNPTRNPMLPNLDPHLFFNNNLARILDIPQKSIGSPTDGTLHIISRSPLNMDVHQPEIFISSPSLPINSRTNKISHNTLARVPVGLADNQGSQAGLHFHELYNLVYHKLHNSQEASLNQIEVRLTDRLGGNLTQLLHPSTLTLHVDTIST